MNECRIQYDVTILCIKALELKTELEYVRKYRYKHVQQI